jgi:hypothetical protein
MAANISVSTANISTAQRDKQLMDLQHQIEQKEAQLKQDYQRLLRDVKHNPYLHVAIEEYKTYFAKEKKAKEQKIKALTLLLQDLQQKGAAEADLIDIKREIKVIKQN